MATSLSQTSEELTWLPEQGVIEITERTALVGHGGWGDARVGDFMASTVSLNDYLLIEELQATHRFPESGLILTEDLKTKLHSLGDESASFFRRILPEAFQNYDEVIVLTHVPPFHEACWHEGKHSDLNWTPHFVCQAVGEVLLDQMKGAPDKRMIVLCGHTHSGGEVRMLDNLLVKTGSATYRNPQLQEVMLCK